MCRAVRCARCGKTTWSGCGQHVDEVMRDVPPSQQCTCSGEKGRSGGFFSGIFGKRSS